jgi:hypothetical protein
MDKLSNVLPQCLSHMLLLDCRGLTVAHWHDFPVIGSEWSHCHKQVIVWVDVCLEECVCQIKFTPEFSHCKVGKDVINVRERKSVRNDIGIKLSEVNNPLLSTHPRGVYRVCTESVP